MTKKGKDNVGDTEKEIIPVPDDLMGVFGTGTITNKKIHKTPEIEVLARSVASRCIGFVLRRIRIEHLYAALTYKLGKPPKKSEIVRHGHKMYAQGYEKAIKDNQAQWL